MTFEVHIGTTGGAVRIERITPEPTPRSLVCLQRTSKVQRISAAYHDFVRPGSGVIHKVFGPFEDPGSFRLDLSHSIGDGESWQLAVFVAHAAQARGGLAGVDEAADQVVWLTGRVDCDLGVGAVDHVTEKIDASLETFAAWRDAGREVTLVLPSEADAQAARDADLPEGVRVVAATRAPEVLELLDLAPPSLAPSAQGLVTPVEAAPACIAGAPRPRGKRPPGAWVLPLIVAIVTAIGGGFFAGTPKVGPEAEKQVAEKPKPTGKVILAIRERRAPEGETCAKVHFERIDALEAPVPHDSSNRARASSHDGLCGLAFSVTLDGDYSYAAARVVLEQGRYVELGKAPTELGGAVAFGGKQSWAVNVPRRLKAALEYRLVAVAGIEPVGDDLEYLLSAEDWQAVVDDLESQGLKVAWLRHDVLP